MSEEVVLTQKPKRRSKLLGIIIFILILGLAGTSGYFYYQYYRLSKSSVMNQLQAEEETVRLVKALGKLMLIPKDETPTIATVTDVDKLKDQSFFKDAKNGNKVIIFPNIKQVIIYDPEQNLIINVGSINFSGDQPTSEKQPTSN